MENKFNQEAETLEKLGKHPQIPELFAHYTPEMLNDGQFYIVQEYVVRS